MKEKQITKIVITGGPCAGKTTGMEQIKKVFTKRGYSVVFIHETATELITGGIAPWNLKSSLDYQICQMKLQLEKEKVFQQGAEKIADCEKVLIVCDRGMMDNKAYMSETEFEKVLSALQLNETEIIKGYDAVFHLVTAAKGSEENYTLDNNNARTETPEEAILLDEKLISAWSKHPYLRVIENKQSFDEKMKQLVGEISLFLEEI